jgi:hypothetical protein
VLADQRLSEAPTPDIEADRDSPRCRELIAALPLAGHCLLCDTSQRHATCSSVAGSKGLGAFMVNGDRPAVTPESTDHVYADLEAQLVRAVSDFGLEELHQMLDVAEVIRRTRRL